MAPTKTTAGIDAWASVAQAGFREGVNTDVSDAYEATLHIDCALATTTAHTGTEMIVQIGTDTGDGDENWSTLVRFIGVTGTAISTIFAATEPAAETTIAITDPATNNQDNDKKFKFVENTVDADSEIVYQVSNTGDGGDTVTIQDGLAFEQDITTSIMYDIDHATAEAISMHQIALPNTADRVRVLYNNNYDPDGSVVFTRTRITKTTGL